MDSPSQVPPLDAGPTAASSNAGAADASPPAAASAADYADELPADVTVTSAPRLNSSKFARRGAQPWLASREQ